MTLMKTPPSVLVIAVMPPVTNRNDVDTERLADIVISKK